MRRCMKWAVLGLVSAVILGALVLALSGPRDARVAPPGLEPRSAPPVLRQVVGSASAAAQDPQPAALELKAPLAVLGGEALLEAAEDVEVKETPQGKDDEVLRERVVRLAKPSRYSLVHVTERVVPAKEKDAKEPRKSERVLFRQMHVADQVMIKLKPGVNQAALERLNNQFGATIKRKMLAPDMYLVQLKRASLNAVADAVVEYQKAAEVISYAEPNYIVHAIETVPNDTRFSELYAMRNTGQTGGTAGADIKATLAWDITKGSADVLVGVIDTGIDYTHPDLAANIWTNPGEIAGNGIDDDGNGFIDDIHGYDFAYGDSNPIDGHYHGTHCAGTIGGVGGNGLGVTGVCWNVKMVAIKFLDDGGSGTTDAAIDATYYATTVGCHLTSNSWGGGGFSQALKDAIDDAGAHGALFVAAAGNSGSNNDTSPHYPSSYESTNIISVAATDHNDAMAYFSCYGLTSVDLGAPGVNILSCQPGNLYQQLSGTSMATPHVSGVCALVKSLMPTAPVDTWRSQILNNVDPIPALTGKCVTGGRLNAFKAVQALAGPVLALQNSSFDDSMGNGDGIINPGEQILVTVTVKNVGIETAANANAALIVNPADSLISISPSNLSWGDLSPGQTVQGQFTVTVSSSCPTPHNLPLYLSMTATDHAWTSGISKQVLTSAQVGGLVTLDGTPLANAQITYTGARTGTVMTGADGRYGFLATDGTYAVKASYSGYLDSTTVSVTTPPGRVDLDFAFVTATVSGQIVSMETGLGVPGATVSFTGSFSGTVTADANGNYAIARVFGRAGTLSLTAQATGYLPVGPVGVSLPPNVTQNFQLGRPNISVAPTSLLISAEEGGTASTPMTMSNSGSLPLTFSIAAGMDGTPSGLWHKTSHRVHGTSDSWYYGIDGQWNYNTGATNSGALVIDNVQVPAGSPMLTFWQWRQTEGSSYYDQCLVQVSTNGGTTWTTAYQSLDNTATWVQASASLASYAGQTVKLRFFFDTVDSALNTYEGWYLSEIQLNGQGSGWLSAAPASGTVATGGSQVLTVTANAADLIPGLYEKTLNILSNDPDSPVVAVPVQLTVTAAPKLQLASATYNESAQAPSNGDGDGVVEAGERVSLTTLLQNIGHADIAGLSGTLSCSSAYITIQQAESTFPDLVAGQSGANPSPFVFDVLSTVPNNHVATFTLTVSGAGRTWVLTTNLTVANRPQVAVAPASLSQMLKVGRSASQLMSVSNSGTQTLNWTATVPSAAYTFSDSDAAGGPAYNWIEISGTGTPITGFYDDTNLGPYNIGFSFPFYGQAFTSFRVCSNGWLSFTATDTSYSNYALPSSSAPANLVAFFWDDLYFTAGGTAYYQLVDPLTLVVEYKDVCFYSDNTKKLTCQVILKADGSILFQYQKVEVATSSTIGIQNADRTQGLQVAYNQTYAKPNLAVRILPSATWLSVSPTSGQTVAGASTPLNATFNAAGLTVGSYVSEVRVSSNDPVTPLVVVPASLTVVLNRAPSAVDQDVVLNEDQPAQVVLTGSDPDEDTLTYTVTGGPAHGTLTGTAPALTYTPQPNYYGPDSFAFVVNDGMEDSAVATVSITVQPVNDPPYISEEPLATPNPVTGTTTQLSVGASDIDTEWAQLTYTWSVVAKPQGAADPVISPNGTTNSDLATATFSAAGTYTFRVTVSDGSASCTGEVQVVVLQTLTTLSVSPATVDVVAGATQAFAAAGGDQFGAAMVVTPVWTVSGGGTIDATGSFTAVTPGGPYTVQAAVGTMHGEAVVSVTGLPGLIAEFFDFNTALSVLPTLSGMTPDAVRLDAQVNYPSTSGTWTGLDSRFTDTFATRHSGYLLVSVAGSYTLYISSDDGSKLWLDGALLINNDGLHGMREYSATVALQPGYHALRIESFENGGSAGLIFSWAGPGITKRIVPAAALFHADSLPGGLARVAVSAADAEASEPNAAANKGTAKYRFTRNGSLTASLVVKYAMSGTAVNGSDYNTLSGTATIAAGSTYVDVTLTAKTDALDEENETATATLVADAAYVIDSAKASATVAIYDAAYGLPTVSASVVDAEASEPNAATNKGTAKYRFTRTGSLHAALTVKYAMSGTAVNGSDYNTLSGTATIAAGSTYVDVTLTAKTDALDEENETATATLVADAAYVIDSAKAAATVTIYDAAYGPPTVSASAADAEASEPNAAVNKGTARYRFTRSGSLHAALTVKYAMSGTAVNGSDYNTLSGAATIGVGSTYVDVTLTAKTDALNEENETATATLVTDAAYLIDSAKAAATLTIYDAE